MQITFPERVTTMHRYKIVPLNAVIHFYLYLSATVGAAEEDALPSAALKRRGYSRGELMPVSCLNRTM